MKNLFRRVMSFVLSMTMVFTMMPAVARAEEAENVKVTLSDIVAVNVDGTSYDMDLYLDGMFETGVDLSAGKHQVKVTVNGEDYLSGKEVSLDGNEKVYFRLSNGTLKDSVNDEIVYEHATLVGNFWGIEFVDDADNRYDINNWSPADTNGDLEYIGGGFYKRTFKFKQLSDAVTLNDSGYKVAFNQNWDYSLGNDGNNIGLTIPAGASEWTVWVDEINKTVYDNFRIPSYTTNHNNGVTIQRNPLTTVVSLVGSMNGWNVSVGSGYDFSLISDSLYRYSMILNAGSYEYKVKFDGNDWYENSGNHSFNVAADGTKVTFIYDLNIDVLYDSVNDSEVLSNIFGIDASKGSEDEPVVERKANVPGTFPGPTWDPASNEMTNLGNGLFSYKFENVPAGNYEYKIAFGSWAENYGVSGYRDGSNYSVYVPFTQDVTVYYSDTSHLSVTSLSYKSANASVEITPDNVVTMNDDGLTGIYSCKAYLGAGSYNIKIKVNGEDFDTAVFSIDSEREVTFFYDPTFEICYNDAAKWTVDDSKFKFDSKDSYFKSPFGAAEVGEDVTFTVETDKNVTSVSLVTKLSDSNIKSVELTQKDNTEDEEKKTWSVTTQFNEIGRYQYYFTISSGGLIKIYADDSKGDYGTGKVAEFFDVYNPAVCKPYDLTVCTSGYKTPDWMKDAVIYQIFPDRFANGDTTNDKAQTSSRGATDYEFPEWNKLPENPEQEDRLSKEQYEATGAFYGDRNWSNEMYGGDFAGIVNNIEYLKALGVTVIYLNPVFSSISSHRYDATDYSKIDPILGDLGDFTKLVEVAEKNDMKIVLDGVFNHVSDDSIYFDRYYKFLTAENFDGKIGAYPYWAFVFDYMSEKNAGKEEAENAAKEYFEVNYNVNDYCYTTWFDVYSSYMSNGNGGNVYDTIGLRTDKPVYGYEGWWGYDSMPVIKSTNGSEYQTEDWAKTIIGKADENGNYENNGSIAQYWLSKGSNGWRLDVANEVSDETWQNFRKSVKAMDSDAVIIGEIWDDATGYLEGDMYDSVMNYVFRNAVLGYAKGGRASDAMATLERIRERYPKEAFYAMMNLVDSHDTSRVLSYLDGVDDDRNQKDINSAFPKYESTSDKAKKRQYLVAFLQFTYPGAPTIYYGDELGVVGADDPDDRRTINWGNGNEALVTYYATLSAIRHEYSALRTGSIKPLYLNNENVLAYVRSDEKNTLIVLANNGDNEAVVTVDVNALGLSSDEKVTDLISGTVYEAGDVIEVTVGAISGAVLTTDPKEILVNKNGLRPAYDPTYKPEDDKPEEDKPSEDKPSENGTSGNTSSQETPVAGTPSVLSPAGNVPAEGNTIRRASTETAPVVTPAYVTSTEEKTEVEEQKENVQEDVLIGESTENKDSTEKATINENEVPMTNMETSKEKSLVWVWILLAVVVAAGAGYTVFRFKLNGKEE